MGIYPFPPRPKEPQDAVRARFRALANPNCRRCGGEGCFRPTIYATGDPDKKILCSCTRIYPSP